MAPDNPHVNNQFFSTNYEKKWHEIDWSKSILDSNVSRGILDFNSLRDQSIIMPFQVEDYLGKKHIGGWEVVYVKLIKTLEKLIQELMLPKGLFVIPPKNYENLDILLKECSKLFRARALVVKILSSIHKREDILLKIMSFDNEDENLKRVYVQLGKINQDILQSIGYLSQVGSYFGEFIYLGENYSQKVLKDDQNIKELFPGLKYLEEI